MNRLLEFAGLVMFAWLLVLAFAWTCAHAAFQPGIVNPTPIAATDSAALGSMVQRYHLQWEGEPTYTGSLALARRARVSHRYVCAHAHKGAQIPATRENIMRGVCVVDGG